MEQGMNITITFDDFGNLFTASLMGSAGVGATEQEALGTLAVELARAACAEAQRPGGGEDFGFSLDASGWVRVRGGVTTVIAGWYDEGRTCWLRTKSRGGRQIASATFPFARSAMRAK